jgi:hypothetical protein
MTNLDCFDDEGVDARMYPLDTSSTVENLDRRTKMAAQDDVERTAATIRARKTRFTRLSDRDRAFLQFWTGLAERHGGSVTLEQIQETGESPDYLGSSKPYDAGAVNRLRQAGFLSISDDGHRLTPMRSRPNDAIGVHAGRPNAIPNYTQAQADSFKSVTKRRVWLRAFWGFSPEDEGYLGFTHEGNRARFLREYQDGDLVLILWRR